jgi:hypothetical protein
VLGSAAVRRAFASRSWTPGLALLAALLLPAAQAASFVHLALVRHTTCPEHGELVEGGPVAHAGAAVTAPGISESAQVPAEHAHDHCTFAAHLRQGVERARTMAALVLPPSRPAPHVAPPAPQLSGPSLLSLAPKQSPPAG